MGLNEDLGDRENVGSAAVATQRHREAREKDRQEAEKFANWMIEVVNADHHDKIEFNRDIGCRIRDHIENLRRDLLALRGKSCPFTKGEMVQVNAPSYTGTGIFEETGPPMRYGIRLQHEQIRYYDPETVSKIREPK